MVSGFPCSLVSFLDVNCPELSDTEYILIKQGRSWRGSRGLRGTYIFFGKSCEIKLTEFYGKWNSLILLERGLYIPMQGTYLLTFE